MIRSGARIMAAGALGAAVLVVTVNSSSGDDLKPARPKPGPDRAPRPRPGRHRGPGRGDGDHRRRVRLDGRSGVGARGRRVPALLRHPAQPDLQVEGRAEGSTVYLEQERVPRTRSRGPTTSRPTSPGSNGLVIDPEGRLVLCQHGNRQVARMDAPLSKPQPKYVTDRRSLRGEAAQQPERRRLPRRTARSTSPTRPTGSRGRWRTRTSSSTSRACTVWAPTASSRC